jgi:ABC-type multidrug transport system fused ATPase/permease subunit
MEGGDDDENDKEAQQPGQPGAIEMHDIQIEEQKEEPGAIEKEDENQKSGGADHRNPTQVLNVDMSKYQNKAPDAAEGAQNNEVADLTTSEKEELDEFSNTNVLILVTRNFQKSTFWFTFVITLLAMRGASGFSILCAYVSVLLRLCQVVSIITQKKRCAHICYSVATFLLVIMWFTAFISEGTTVQEAVRPSQKSLDELKSIMFGD